MCSFRMKCLKRKSDCFKAGGCRTPKDLPFFWLFLQNTDTFTVSFTHNYCQFRLCLVSNRVKLCTERRKNHRQTHLE